jgi:hypothetical protein
MENKLHRYKTTLFSSSYDDVFSCLMPAGHRSAFDFLFIAGSGRNGSTLLSAILNNHPAICIPPEHRMIPTSIRYWHTHPQHSWERKIDAVCSFLAQPSQWNADISSIKNNLLQFPKQKRSLAPVLEYIYHHMVPTGKSVTVLGDKTPSNTTYIKLIKKQFPGSKIIFLVRDPRDVMASYLKANEPYYTERFDFMLWRWKDAIEKYRSLVKRSAADVLLVKYEDLVTDPSESVKAILQLLNLDFHPRILEDYNKNIAFLGVQEAVHHQNINNPISTTSIGAWRLSLPQQLAERTTKKLTRYMKDLNYSF